MTGEEAIEMVEAAFDAWEYQYSTGDDWSKEHEAKDMAIKALKLIPDNATNGEVIKALFPQIETKKLSKAEVLCIHNTLSASCDIDWWNAPYKRGDE